MTSIAVIIIAIYFFLRFQEFNSYTKRGDELISKINKFEKIENQLPNATSDFKVDIEMGEGPYYEKLNDTTFIVYFNIGFDDKIIFNSNKKKWEYY